MGKSNKKIIVEISIITVIIMLIAAGVVLYLYTDLFKNDQQLFYKYIAQNGEMISKYLENPNKENIDSLKQNKYFTEGTISFDLVSNDTEIANQTIPARNFSVEYKTQVDPQSKKDSTQTTLKFLDKDLFELKYAHNNDLYGITSSEVINKYLTFENNNLKELATKYRVTDVTNIPDKIEMQDYSQIFTLADEEIQYILENYGSIFTSQISKDKYYHNKGIMIDIGDNQIEGNCYGVNISKEDLRNVINEILNKLQQDDQILNALIQRVKMLNSEVEITKENLKEAISELTTELQENADIQDIKIEIYESEGKLVKQLIETEDGNVCTIEYETNEDSARVIISFEYSNIDTSTQDISFKVKNIELAKQSKLEQSNDVAIFTIDTGDNQTYKISVQNKMEQVSQTEINNNIIINISNSETYFTIKANSVTTQSNDVIVEELTNENSAVINKFTPEYTTSLMQDIGNRLQTLLNRKLLIISTAQQEADEQITIQQSGSNGTIIENTTGTNTVNE